MPADPVAFSALPSAALPSAVSPLPLYACLYHPPRGTEGGGEMLAAIAREFSPRYERHRDDLVSIDVSGLDRLVGDPRTIGKELQRYAAGRGVHVHVAIAATREVAQLLALSRPGVTIVDRGTERDAVAPLPVTILERLHGAGGTVHQRAIGREGHAWEGAPLDAASMVNTVKRWGIRTLGELAALPSAALSSRLGQRALGWQAIARGQDAAPMVPTLPGERFESTLDLEWPVDEVVPLSFVLTRLLEPLSAQLERRDRGVARLHLRLRLVTREEHVRRLQLPAPIRDVRALRTLLMLDLESNPPSSAIDRVTIAIDPTPGRIVQHTLFTRAQPTPEQLSTLVARLGALMGQDRIGAPATVDSYRPGAFVVMPFATDHEDHDNRRARGAPRDAFIPSDREGTTVEDSGISAVNVVSALRRCRRPVPARVVADDGRPRRIATDRSGFSGGAVVACSGPWRTSGNWWVERAGGAGGDGALRSWNRDEWDVALADGTVYRLFRDREADAWFVDGIVD